MFGYVRPYKSELLVRQYQQYKAVYCQLCRTLGKEYGWLSKLTLSYDCTLYALLGLAVHGARVKERRGRCRANPLKKCTFLPAEGDEYAKAASLQLLLTRFKLEDDRADEGFFKSLASRLLLLYARPKAKKAAARYPFLEALARSAVTDQAAAEAAHAGVDACAEPTARLLSGLFRELAGCDEAQALALSEFGYYLGRWVYLMDAADDLAEDLSRGKFNPFVTYLGLEGQPSLTPERKKEAETAMNEILNATVARMIPPLNLVRTDVFGPILENVVRQGLPEVQRELLFLHVREKKKLRQEP